jgi:hypothetical protein
MDERRHDARPTYHGFSCGVFAVSCNPPLGSPDSRRLPTFAGALSPRWPGQAAQDVDAVRRCLRREEVRYRAWFPSGAAEELNRPLGHSGLRDVDELPGVRLVDVLLLQDQREGLLSPRNRTREGQRGWIGTEGMVVVASVCEVGRTSLWMAPYPVLQNGIPHVSTTRTDERRIGTHSLLTDSPRVACT